MTDSNLTLIGILVDRSGSMISMKSEMDLALKTFLDEQADLEGRVAVSLAEFDSDYEEIWKMRDIHDLPHYEIRPRYATALLDAMGRFITDIGQELADRREEDRPGKVLICIITDGAENASQHWTAGMVRKLVAQQQKDYSWEFLFLGANIDAVSTATNLGIDANSALTFNPARSGVAMAAMSNYVSSYRTTGAANFTDSDRQSATQTK